MTNEELVNQINACNTVADQFDFYLKKSKLKQSEMSDVQFVETRRAFYAGFGQMIILLTTKIGDVPDEEEGVDILDGFLTEVREFYEKEYNF